MNITLPELQALFELAGRAGTPAEKLWLAALAARLEADLQKQTQTPVHQEKELTHDT